MPSKRVEIKAKNPVAPPSPQNFQFINFTDTLNVDEYDRDVIRTQAISDYHRRMRTGNPRSSLAKSDQAVKGSVGKFRLRRKVSEPHKPSILAPPSKSTFPVQNISQSSVTAHRIIEGSSSENLVIDSEITSSSTAGDVPAERAPRRETNDQKTLQQRFLRRDREISQATTEFLAKKLDLLAIHLDPLLNFPINFFDPDRIRLWMHYYFNDRNLASLLMVSVRKSWLRTSLEDPAFFAAVSSHYAGRYSLGNHQGDPHESLLLRMDAIKTVNKRITEADGHVSDGTIGAVASLVTYESNNGTFDAIRTHMEGLSRMIELRGGFQKADFPPPLQRLLGWAEITALNVLPTPPTMPPLPFTGLYLPSYNHTTIPNLPITKGQQDYVMDSENTEKSLPDIFAGLRHLSSILESRNPASVALTDSMWYSDKVYDVQRNLVYSSLGPEQDVLHTACYIAGSMYVNSYLRDLGFHSGVITLLVTKLKDLLEQKVLVSLAGYSVEELEMILWILVIGGVCAMGRRERSWFVEWLVVVCEALRLDTCKETEEVLGKMVWSRDWKEYLEVMWQEFAGYTWSHRA